MQWLADLLSSQNSTVITWMWRSSIISTNLTFLHAGAAACVSFVLISNIIWGFISFKVEILFFFLHDLLRLLSGRTHCKQSLLALFLVGLCASVIALENLLLKTIYLGLELIDFMLICTSLQGLMLTFLLDLVKVFD